MVSIYYLCRLVISVLQLNGFTLSSKFSALKPYNHVLFSVLAFLSLNHFAQLNDSIAYFIKFIIIIYIAIND